MYFELKFLIKPQHKTVVLVNSNSVSNNLQEYSSKPPLGDKLTKQNPISINYSKAVKHVNLLHCLKVHARLQKFNKFGLVETN